MSLAPQLAVVYEHPEWFKPLFATLERRRVPYLPIRIDEHRYALDQVPPAPVIFSRLAMSSFLRQQEHPIFYAQGLYAHWELAGARVINGTPSLALDASKARQLSLIRSLGLAVPATEVVHRREDILPAADALGYPAIVKVNIGGSGAGVSRYDSRAQLEQALATGSVPVGIDGVWLVQDCVPARDRKMVRVEVLNGKFLYAIALNTDGGTFDLCPADVCMIDKPTVTIEQAKPDAAIVRAAEAIARAGRFDICGIEYMIDERDGTPRFYDINGLSNFVADPLNVLGWDPHEQLVDYLLEVLAQAREQAA